MPPFWCYVAELQVWPDISGYPITSLPSVRVNYHTNISFRRSNRSITRVVKETLVPWKEILVVIQALCFVIILGWRCACHCMPMYTYWYIYIYMCVCIYTYSFLMVAYVWILYLFMFFFATSSAPWIDVQRKIWICFIIICDFARWYRKKYAVQKQTNSENKMTKGWLKTNQRCWFQKCTKPAHTQKKWFCNLCRSGPHRFCDCCVLFLSICSICRFCAMFGVKIINLLVFLHVWWNSVIKIMHCWLSFGRVGA